MILFDLALDIGGFKALATAALMVVFAVVYFLLVVIGVIFLTSGEFKPNPRRLAIDTCISILFTILAFSTVYRLGGISLTETCEVTFAATDYVYFSAVTFSTLGYGDFRPCPDMRLLAAFQAILGNLHLGLIVGCAFYFTQEMRSISEEPTCDDKQATSDKDG